MHGSYSVGQRLEHTIKQPEGSMICVACVAAMVARTTLEEFIEWAPEPDPGYHDSDMLGWMALHGVFPVCNVRLERQKEHHIDEGTGLRSFYGYKPNRTELILVTKSETNPEWTHVVYWDGHTVHDPKPNTKRTKLEEYEVHEVWILDRLAGFHLRPWMRNYRVPNEDGSIETA